MRSHEVDYEIFGDDMQIVEIELDPGETVIAEAGAMNYMDDDITFEAKMGDGSKPDDGVMGKLLNVGKRVLTGESIFITHFTNSGSGKKRVAFSAPYPGKIIPLDMPKLGGDFICQKDAFLCAALGTEVGIAFHKRLGAGFFGGEGFILQRLRGDGMAFVHAGGTVITKEMKGETLRVDTGCIVAFSTGIDYDIQRAGGLKSMFFGGEGLFLATLRGTGTVLLQSLPFSRLADRIIKHAPSAGVSAREKDRSSAAWVTSSTATASLFSFPAEPARENLSPALWIVPRVVEPEHSPVFFRARLPTSVLARGNTDLDGRLAPLAFYCSSQDAAQVASSRIGPSHYARRQTAR